MDYPKMPPPSGIYTRMWKACKLLPLTTGVMEGL